MNIREQVINIIKLQAEIIGIKTDNLEDNGSEEIRIMEDLNFDSLDCVQMVLDLEETFKIEIPDEDAERLLTIGSIVEYVKEKIKEE